ncbi:MAG: hypothetical protein O2954_07910, partial [bacterium]|nr:hypothetical protein [bacterium]
MGCVTQRLVEAAAVFCLLGLWDGAAAFDIGPAARSTEGQTAWTICHKLGNAALTELWVKGRDGDVRRLGIFPGRPAALAWRADGMRLLYRDIPLALPRLNLPGLLHEATPLVAAETWEVSASGEIARRLLSGEVLSEELVWGMPEDSSAAADEVLQMPIDEAKEVLAGLAEGFNTVAMAYSALHRQEFDLARARFRQAAQQFEGLPQKHTRLFQQPFMNYARAMAVHSRQTEEEAQRGICLEHLAEIGNLLVA